MDKHVWWWIGGGSLAAAGVVGAYWLTRRPKTAGSTASSSSTGSRTTTAAAVSQRTTMSPSASSTATVSHSTQSASLPTQTQTSIMRLQWANAAPQGVSTDTVSLTLNQPLATDQRVTLYAAGTDLAGIVPVGTLSPGHQHLTYTVKGGPGSAVTVWAVLTQNGRVVTQTGRITAVWRTSSGATTTLPGYPSPYGTNPQKVPSNCPSGYDPIYTPGYGWTCAETPATAVANLKSAFASANNLGITLSSSGVTVAGLTPYQQAQLAAATLGAKYGQTYHVYYQNGSYVVTTLTRAAQLVHEGASNLYTVNSSGQPANNLTDLAISVAQSTPPTNTQSYTYHLYTQATAYNRNTAAQAQLAALKSAITQQYPTFPSTFSGYVRVNLGNGNFSDVYVQNGKAYGVS